MTAVAATILPLDLAKYLAINTKNQREKDQYIIDNAQWYECLYRTHRTNLPSEKFTDLEAARTAGRFTSRVIAIVGRNKLIPIHVMACLKDSKGALYSALVEQIAVRDDTNA